MILAPYNKIFSRNLSSVLYIDTFDRLILIAQVQNVLAGIMDEQRTSMLVQVLCGLSDILVIDINLYIHSHVCLLLVQKL